MGMGLSIPQVRQQSAGVSDARATTTGMASDRREQPQLPGAITGHETHSARIRQAS